MSRPRRGRGRRRARLTAIAAVLVAAAACDSSPKTGSAPRTGGVAAMAPDTMMKRLESAGAARKADSLRDSAFGPKFAVDSSGKVRPIRPPKRP